MSRFWSYSSKYFCDCVDGGDSGSMSCRESSNGVRDGKGSWEIVVVVCVLLGIDVIMVRVS